MFILLMSRRKLDCQTDVEMGMESGDFAIGFEVALDVTAGLRARRIAVDWQQIATETWVYELIDL